MSFREKAAGAMESKRNLKKFSDFWGTWMQYKLYLHEHGALHHDLVETLPLPENKKALNERK